MWQFLHYLFYGAFLQPSAESICRAGEICPIDWNTSTNGHLELELKINNTWDSIVDNQHHFLSIIVDESTQHYDWQVPWYLTTFWEHPKRMVLTDLVTKEKTYSSQFLVPGVAFQNSITSSLYPEQIQTIEWVTNEPNNTLFSMNLEGSTDYGQVVPFILTNNETFEWNVSNYPDPNVRLKILAKDVQTYGYSNTFAILESTTTTITTTTSRQNTTGDNKNSDEKYIWLLLIITGSLIFVTFMSIIIYHYCKNNLLSNIAMGIGGSGSVHPSDSTQRTLHAYQNQIYEQSTAKYQNHNNIYDSPPALPRPIDGNRYNRLTRNEYNHLLKQQIITRDMTMRNPNYISASSSNVQQVRVKSPTYEVTSFGMRRSSSGSSTQNLYHYPNPTSQSINSKSSSEYSSSLSSPSSSQSIPTNEYKSGVARGPVLI